MNSVKKIFKMAVFQFVQQGTAYVLLLGLDLKLSAR